MGAGSLLIAAYRLARLRLKHGVEVGALLGEVLDAAAVSVEAAAGQGFARLPASRRLAFRELGLAIGLHGVERLHGATTGRSGFPADGALAALARHLPLAAEIDAFWNDPAHRAAPTWRDHPDINTVMLTTSLAPDGYLGPLEAPGSG